jgi:isopropylmalate/homocitrate/citramalate synthase
MGSESTTSNLLGDPLRAALDRGELAFCEEVARDGAQAKTLLDGDQRIELATRHAALLGAGAFDRLIFAAGFPGIAPEEREIVRRMAAEVEVCQLMAVCRLASRDVAEAVDSVTAARQGRILLVAPTSEAISHSLLHTSAAESLQRTLDMIRLARDLGTDVHVDVALVDAPRADPALVVDAANVFTEAGGSAMVLCDTVGACTPLQTRSLAEAVTARCDPSVLLGIHIHNDLGFGLASTIEAVRCGIRYVTSSWLGLAERSGMAATEQLLVALASEPEAIEARYGIEGPIWSEPPVLDDLVPLVHQIARWLEIPLKVTDPVVGTGVNTISTGTPFRDPLRFVPYDAEALLGVPRTIVVTQLASRRVIQEAALELGVSLSLAEVDDLTRQVKERCYRLGEAVVPAEEFAQLLDDVRGREEPEASGLSDRSPVRAASLPESEALPLEVMESAARALPRALAWFEGAELMLSREAADAYLRVVRTDFSSTAWHLDREQDATAVAIWVGLGGSFIADFASAPEHPRIFAWVLSPDPDAAQYALKGLKGRDGRWVPTSLLTTEEEFLGWLDSDREPVNREGVREILDLGPVGFRFAIRMGALPSYFVLRGFDGASAQVVLPGRSPVWARWLARFESRTGHRFAGVTSANFSELGREVLSGGTHKDLAETQADMGYLGVPILSGPIELEGEAVGLDDRTAAYKRLNAPYLDLPPEAWSESKAMLPSSVSLLGFTENLGRWELLRHGSLHESVLRARLEQCGVSLEHRAGQRLELSRYVGDLLAAFPLFAGLGARHIAEISQLVELQRFEADETIVRAGEPADRMYFIASGSLLARVEPEVKMGPGEFFGEIALVEGLRRTATVRGLEPGVLLVLTTHVLHRLMEEMPPLADPIRRSARERLERPGVA